METWDRGILTRLELRTTGGRLVFLLFVVILLLLAITVLFPFLFAFDIETRTWPSRLS